jgi:hypothetical protein
VLQDTEDGRSGGAGLRNKLVRWIKGGDGFLCKFGEAAEKSL